MKRHHITLLFVLLLTLSLPSIALGALNPTNNIATNSVTMDGEETHSVTTFNGVIPPELEEAFLK